MKIWTKGLLLIAVPTVFELVFVAFLLHAQADATHATSWAVHSQQVIVQSAAVERPLYREAANLRLAVLTDRHNVHGGKAFWYDVDRRLNALKTLVSDNPIQVTRVQAITRAFRDFRAWDDKVDSLIGTGARGAALEQMLTGSGQRLIGVTEDRIGQFIREEQLLSTQRMAVAEKARESQKIILIGTAVGTVLLGVLAVLLFARGVAGRLATVTRNARRLAEGTPLEVPVEGKDEVAELDRVLHHTASRLWEADAAESRLRSELQKRAEELSLANEHLRQQTQENEMFIYSVSHDLRSPLVNLQGFGKELQHACGDLRTELQQLPASADQKRRLEEILDQDMGESLRFLHTAVSRAANIIDALLRLSRAGRVEYQMRRVDVAEIATRVVDAMRRTIREKGVTVHIKDLPPAFGDPSAVETVFGNLIGNAVNYLDPARPGTVEIGSLDRTAPETGHRETLEGMQVYYVKDNGMGIPEAYMNKIFTAFQRLHGNVAKGEGIGLALVRRVVERHGGNAWVSSEEGAGTTFFVSLPAWQESEHPLAEVSL